MAVAVEKITYTATPEQIERMHQAFDEALADGARRARQDLPDDHRRRGAAGRRHLRGARAGRPQRRSSACSSGARSRTSTTRCAAAKAAFPAWSGRPYGGAGRDHAARRGADPRAQVPALGAAHLEAGKNRAEAIGEVEEGADLIDEYARQMEENNGFVRRLGSLDPARAQPLGPAPVRRLGGAGAVQLPARALGRHVLRARWWPATPSSTNRPRRRRSPATSWRAATSTRACRPGSSTTSPAAARRSASR